MKVAVPGKTRSAHLLQASVDRSTMPVETETGARVRRTKIVATLGPASRDPTTIDSIIKAGADVLRLNFAHADAAIHAETARRARDASLANERVVGLLSDLPGPKMRTGQVRDGEVNLEPGQTFALTADTRLGDEASVSTTVDHLPELVAQGDEIFLADGQIVLEVERVEGETVETEVLRGGTLRSGKGMHIPGAELKVESFTKRDKEALRASSAIGVDLVGVSFVRSATDVERIKEELALLGQEAPAVVAKIETRAAVDNLEEIVEVADAVMVARGDLGIQLPFREVPLLQKDIIRVCNEIGRPVITATQMLESMTRAPLPTRAEVNDVANAVMDGTDAVMLSEETAIGDYPVDSVRVMSEIALEAEGARTKRQRATPGEEDPVSWAIARAAVQASEELHVAAILCPTRSGATARRVAAFRPSMPVLAIDHSIGTLRRLALVWGVVPYQVPFLAEEELAVRGLERALTAARASGAARAGELVTLVAGGSAPRAGSTDLVRILSL